MSYENFQPIPLAGTMTISASNANTQATRAAASAQNAHDALFINAGTKTVFVRWGNVAMTATTSDVPILAGATVRMFVGDALNFAAICGATDTTTLYIVPGTGC